MKEILILIMLLLVPTAVASDGYVAESNQPRIAFIMPTFSNTAFAGSFYTFFRLHENDNQTYITADLQFLNVTIRPGWFCSGGISRFLNATADIMPQLLEGNTYTIIDERDVDMGALFSDAGSPVYDVVVCGFVEYVTAREYADYRKFVALGGTLVLNDACNFLAEVAYHPCANGSGYLSLVRGKGWEFNGTHAWRSVYHRWPEENRNWVGSNYWKWWIGDHYDAFNANTSHPISEFLRSHYGTPIETSYHGHEENKIENVTNTRIIGYWRFTNSCDAPSEPVAAYQHNYLEGTVFHSGIIASEVLHRDAFLASFLIGAIRIGLGLDAAHEISYEEIYLHPGPTNATTTSTTGPISSTTLMPIENDGLPTVLGGIALSVIALVVILRLRKP